MSNISDVIADNAESVPERKKQKEIKNNEKKFDGVLAYTQANIYEVQEKFDEVASEFIKIMNIDKETFAECCLSWVRHEAKWKE